MSTRRRLSPEESRTAALVAARILLIETGPQSVTLKAVAARIGRTHANLLHHFGSITQKAIKLETGQKDLGDREYFYRRVGMGWRARKRFKAERVRLARSWIAAERAGHGYGPRFLAGLAFLQPSDALAMRLE